MVYFLCKSDSFRSRKYFDMNYTLEQLADMNHVFSRPKAVTERRFSLEDLKTRSHALAQKKMDADGTLKICEEDAEKYAELAASIEEGASKIILKFKDCPFVSTLGSKGTRLLLTLEYNQNLNEFCELNSQIHGIITDAKHAMDSLHNVCATLPKSDAKILDDLKMSDFINKLR